MKNKKLFHIIMELLLLLGALIILVSSILIIANIKEVYLLEKGLNKNLITMALPMRLLVSSIVINSFIIITIFPLTIWSSLNREYEKSIIVLKYLILAGTFIIHAIYFIYLPLKRNATLSYPILLYLIIILIYAFSLINSLYPLSYHQLTTRMIIENASGVALSVIFSYLADLISPRFPVVMGGFRLSITIVPIYLISFRNGLVSGLITGFIYSLFNVYLDGGLYHIGSLFLDYLLPFSLLGISGFYKWLFLEDDNKKLHYLTMILFIIATSILKYLFHALSGYLFFKAFAPKGVSPVLYSFVFVNLPKVFLEMILAIILILPLGKRLIIPHYYQEA